MSRGTRRSDLRRYCPLPRNGRQVRWAPPSSQSRVATPSRYALTLHCLRPPTQRPQIALTWATSSAGMFLMSAALILRLNSRMSPAFALGPLAAGPVT